MAGDNPIAAPALARGTWLGDEGVLPHDAPIEVLAVDAAGRLGRLLDKGVIDVPGVPASTACWIRWWPEQTRHAQFRSCDLADLDLSDDDWDRLFAMTQDPD